VASESAANEASKRARLDWTIWFSI